MASAKISEKDIDRLAELARIDVPAGEKSALVKEIGTILAYVDEIKNAPVDFDPSPKPGPVKNVTRPDVVRPISSEDRGRLLAEVPHKEGDFVAVKKIIS